MGDPSHGSGDPSRDGRHRPTATDKFAAPMNDIPKVVFGELSETINRELL